MLTETVHSENIGYMTIQLSSSGAWHIEVTEDDKLDV